MTEHTYEQWEDPTPVEFEHGWDIELREDTTAHLEDGKLVIMGWYQKSKYEKKAPDGWHGEFDIHGQLVNICHDPYGGEASVGQRTNTDFGPFPFSSPQDKFYLWPFEIVTNPTGSMGMDRSKLEEAGKKEVGRTIDKFVREMLEGGADKVWRICRRHVIALPADIPTKHIGMMVFCQVVMLGVKQT